MRKKKCQHGRMKQGLRIHPDPQEYYEHYSYCPDCKQRWFDGGRRWNKAFST